MKRQNNDTLRLLALLLCTLLLGTVLGACSSSNKGKPAEEEDEDSKSGSVSADTPELELLDFATTYYDRGAYSLSREAWTALTEGHPGSVYVPLAELKIADTNYFSHNYPEAVLGYEEFVKGHPASEAVPYARFQIGNAHFNQYNDTKRDQAPLKQAIKAYRSLLEQHPTSPYSAIAQQNIKRAIEMLASYEAYVADFYLKQGSIDPAYGRYARLMSYYPESDVAKERGPQLKEALLAAAPDDAARKRYARAIERKQDPSMAAPSIIVSNLALLSESEPIIDEEEEAAAPEADSTPAVSASGAPASTAPSAAQIFAKHESVSAESQRSISTEPISISCQENSTNSVFVVAVPTRPQIVSEVRDNSGQLRVEFASEGKTLLNTEPPARCETKNASVFISDGSRNGVLSALVTNAPGTTITGFALDRPGRVVLVVTNPTSNS